MPHLSIGVDISKDTLDIFSPDDGTFRRLDNRPDAITAWLATLPDQALIVFEATSTYDRPLRTALAASGRQAARANPLRARQFARAAGLLAKTDRVDARMLSQFGQAMPLRQLAPECPARRRLADLVQRRAQLVETRKQEKTRLKQADDPMIRQSINAHLRFLDGQVDSLDAAIRAQIETDDILAAANSRLQQVPGVGPLVAATLIAELPELGTLDRRAIAALAGLAPIAADSGQYRGRRKIYGGRRNVRRALYLAAVAGRRNNLFGKTYDQLIKAGKPTKVAMIATARKILVTLNAMLRDQSSYQNKCAA